LNLHSLVSGAIGSVNPHILGTYLASSGYVTGAPGKRTPSYAAPVSVRLQVQPLTYKDLVQVEGLNLNGTRRALYIYDRADGVVRSLLKGGDLFEITTPPNAGTWLIALMLEQWPDWAKAAVTLQNP